MSTSTSGITEYARDGLTFDVTDRGDPAAPPVLLLHGFPEDRHSWEPVTDRLVDAGLRTLAPDQRGYSPRARPSEPYPQAYTLTELADDAVALLDAAGIEQVHLVGHDWGGALAWTLAGGHPDRVATLTVLSTPHPAALRQAATSAPWQSRPLGLHAVLPAATASGTRPRPAPGGAADLLRDAPGRGRALRRPDAGARRPPGGAGLVPRHGPLAGRGAPVPRPDDVRLGPPRRVPRATGGRVDRRDGARRLPLRRGGRGPLVAGAPARTSVPRRSPPGWPARSDGGP